MNGTRPCLCSHLIRPCARSCTLIHPRLNRERPALLGVRGAESKQKAYSPDVCAHRSNEATWGHQIQCDGAEAKARCCARICKDLFVTYLYRWLGSQVHRR